MKTVDIGVLRRMFGPNVEEVTGWRKYHNGEFLKLCHFKVKVSPATSRRHTGEVQKA